MYTREMELIKKVEAGENLGIIRPLTGLRYSPDHKNMLETIISEDLSYGYRDNIGNEIEVMVSAINDIKEILFNGEPLRDVLGEAAYREENLGFFFSENEKQGYLINGKYFGRKEIQIGKFIISPEGQIERVGECQKVWYNQTEIEEIRIMYGEITKTVQLNIESL